MTVIKHRRGTAADWTAANPVLGQGEIGIEIGVSGNADKYKVGNGTSPWSDLKYYLSEDILNQVFTPRTIKNDEWVITHFEGDGQQFWEDSGGIPIFSIPAAGGPKVFGDHIGAWCGVFDKAIDLTPWGSLQIGQSSPKQIFFATHGPLDAETVDQMTRMISGGYIGGVYTVDARAKAGDLCFSLLDERSVWRCFTSGTYDEPAGVWLPVTSGSSVKAITNHSTNGNIEVYEELLFCYNTINLALPAPNTVLHGREFTIKNAGSGTVQINSHSGGNIIDGDNKVILSAGQSVHLVGITSGWIKV